MVFGMREPDSLITLLVRAALYSGVSPLLFKISTSALFWRENMSLWLVSWISYKMTINVKFYLSYGCFKQTWIDSEIQLNSLENMTLDSTCFIAYPHWKYFRILASGFMDFPRLPTFKIVSSILRPANCYNVRFFQMVNAHWQ